jgi:hypothetical protein
MNRSFAAKNRASKYHVDRYWSEPELRLKKINRARVWQGLPPRQSLDEVETHGRRRP